MASLCHFLATKPSYGADSWLAAGIAILVVPRSLNYIVAGYLIAAGIIGIVQ